MLEFGICLKNDMPVDRNIALAQQAEEAGFKWGWAFDSHVLWKDGMSMLVLLGHNTKKMKWGPLVTNPAVRDLDVAASMFATLNIITDGRAVCGMGRGDSSRRMLGYKPTTIKRMVESAQKLRDLAEGRTRKINDVDVTLTWANPDHKLPMWIAGYGPKVLRAAGAIADGVILQIAEPSLCKWFIEQVNAGALEAGRNPDEIKYMVAAPVYISEDIEKCREQVRWFPAMVGNHIADLIKNNSIGVPQNLLDAINGRVGYDYKHHADKDAGHLEWVTSDVVDSFSVIGTPQMIIDKLKILKDTGVDQFVIYLMCENEENIVDIFGKEIIPELNTNS